MKTQRMRRLLGAALAGVLALTGCGAAVGDTEEPDVKTVEEYVQSARDVLQQAEGFEAGFTAEIVMDGSGEVKTEAEISMVKDPLQAKVDIHYGFADTTAQDSSIYLEEKDDAVNLYMDYDKEWTEMTLSHEDAINNIRIYDAVENMDSLLTVAEDWQAGTQEGDVMTVTARVPAAEVYTVEENGKFFQLAGMSGLSEAYFSDVSDVPVEFSFNWRTGQPISYKMDLADALETVTNNVLKELNGGTPESSVAVEQYLVSAEIIRLGDVESVEIPAAAKSDAINYEKEIRLLEDNKG